MTLPNRNADKKINEYEGFEEFSKFLKSASGISLTPSKHYLVAARIKSILKKYHIDNLKVLVEKLKISTNSSLRSEVVDAMTTNETYWFRDEYPFTYFKNHILPELHAASNNNIFHRGPIRIWSGACSSGQEAYSLSMIYEEYMEEMIDNPDLEIIPRPASIIGTDVSQKMIDAAKLGVYDRLSIVRGLTEERRHKYFIENSSDFWDLKRSVRSRVNFRLLNFIDGFDTLGRFDIIFCRNVLIYFSHDLKNQMLKKLHASLNKGGYLCLGSSEGLSESGHLFDIIHCNPGIIYRAK